MSEVKLAAYNSGNPEEGFREFIPNSYQLQALTIVSTKLFIFELGNIIGDDIPENLWNVIGVREKEETQNLSGELPLLKYIIPSTGSSHTPFSSLELVKFPFKDSSGRDCEREYKYIRGYKIAPLVSVSLF